MTIDIQEINDFTNQINFEMDFLSTICVLPNNYDSEIDPEKYYYSDSLSTVLKLSRQNNLVINVVGKENDYNFLETRGFEWVSPIFCIGALYASENQQAITIALSMIANYLTTIFSGKPENDCTAKFDIFIVKEKDKKTKKISYKGPVNGLSELNETIKQVAAELMKE